MSEYKATIGLEIHAELKTKTKMFCDSKNDPDETEPNVNVCPVCMGHPGTLPVINKEAVKSVIKVGLALNGEIADFTEFDRKNYFYPDIPKGYQISQYKYPLVSGGELEGVKITRVHLEEDTGRLIHSSSRSNDKQIKTNDKRIVLKNESYELMGYLFEVHNELGSVYKEKNYQDAIEHILKKEGVKYEREKSFALKMAEEKVSEFFADFVIFDQILLETKANTKGISQEDIRQVLRYIKSADLPLGIIVNFRKEKLEYKRIINPKFDTDSRKFDDNSGTSLVDFNRAGIPLMELVTEPVITSAKEAGDFARSLQLLLRRLGVAEVNMEKGEMRVEANISVSKDGNMGTKTEVKNLNSFKVAEKAIEYEIKRQSAILEDGGEVVQETRGWDDNKGETFSQRIKEGSADYRYFPDPDLPKLKISEIEDFNLDKLREELPELPSETKERYKKEYGIKEEDIDFFLYNPDAEKLFLASVEAGGDPKLSANYITSDLAGLGGKFEKIEASDFAELVKMASDGEVGSRGVKDILAIIYEKGGKPREIAEKEGLFQKSDEGELLELVQKIIKANPEVVKEFKEGKENALQFLIGQGMKETKGSANPQVLSKLFKENI